jgi:hypothetical protein
MAIQFTPHDGQITVVNKYIFDPETLSDRVFTVFRVILTSEQVEMARRYSKKETRACENKMGPWGGGLIECPSFIGNCGEFAACLLTGQSFDEVFRKKGDDGDLVVGMSERANLKTTNGFYGDLLVRCTDQNGIKEIQIGRAHVELQSP